jgi:hypothetical protein
MKNMEEEENKDKREEGGEKSAGVYQGDNVGQSRRRHSSRKLLLCSLRRLHSCFGQRSNIQLNIDFFLLTLI